MSSSAHFTPGTRLGPYEMLMPLGSGGMGDVYRARDSRLDRHVAVKVLSRELAQTREALERFSREARAVAALSHPNILAIFDIGSAGDLAYLVTELLEGQTLKARLSSGGLSWSEAAEIGAQVADGLAAAHAKGIVHRDIKPENIFLTAERGAKILDFGIARFLHGEASPDAEATAAHTRAGTLIGTLWYMSPEQCSGEAVDARSDLFSLGCVLYEMVARRRAFDGGSPMETLAAILGSEPPALVASEVPAEFDDIVRQCLRKRAAERCQAARDLAAQLRQMIRGSIARTTLAKSPVAGFDSLAVLPFVNAGGDPDAEYFSDGVTESIINNLSQIDRLRVLARSTVFRYKGSEAEGARIGHDLGVAAVLTGKVVLRGSTLRVQAELVKVADGSQLWGQRYNRASADIFSIEEEIAKEISETLRLRLTGEEQQQLEKRHTDNEEAYQLYLKGRYYWNRRGDDTLKRAVPCFESAVAVDPRYALAWSGMAACYTVYGAYYMQSPHESLPRAREAAVNALRLDPSLAEPHVCLGVVAGHLDFDWTRGEQEFRQALASSPDSTTVRNFFTMLLTPMGRTDEAISQARRSLELEPLSLGGHVALATSFFAARRHLEAESIYRKAIELDASFAMPRRWLALTLEAMGRQAEALRELESARKLLPDSPLVRAALARLFAVTDRQQEAKAIIGELERQSRNVYVPSFDIALIYLGLGERDQSLDWLRKSLDEHSFWFMYTIRSVLFDSVRGDPRFRDLMRRMNLSEA